VLTDGSYEAMILDAHTDADGAVHVEITVTTGEHKGEVVLLAGRFPGKDEIDLLAAPATLTVTDGVPALRLDA
jgi:hypothetical protein